MNLLNYLPLKVHRKILKNKKKISRWYFNYLRNTSKYNPIRWLYAKYKVYSLMNQIRDCFDSYTDILSDPMNGCPGDFAEDRDRQVRRLELQLHYWNN